MNDIISIYKKGHNIALPDNLANFRNVTISDRDKREYICQNLGIILNYYLGWHTSTASFEAGIIATGDMNQYQLEKYNSIAPIRITPSFRLAPGEAKRVARRLKYVPMVWSKVRHGWYSNCDRYIKANEDLIVKDTQTPSVIINKYKFRGSRNNSFRDNNIDVNTEFWNLQSEHWEQSIQRSEQSRIENTYYRNNRDRAYEDLYLRDFINPNTGNNNWRYSNSSSESSLINLQHYTIQSFCADVFNLLKESLTIRRNTPEIEYNDEEDYTQMREFLLNQISEIDRCNTIVENIASIREVILTKYRGSIKMYMKFILEEPHIDISHPSGSSEYSSVTRNIKDINGNISDFIGVIQFELSLINNKFRRRNVIFCGYNDNSHVNPGLYNTANRDSRIARVIRGIFNCFTLDSLQNNTCLSEYEHDIMSSIKRLDYLTMLINIVSWYTVYVPGRTNPYRHPRQLFFGIPNDIPEWYKSQHDSSVGACETLVITEYGTGEARNDNETDVLRRVTDDNLKGLLLNHCHNCFHNTNCRVNSYAKETVYDGNETTYQEALIEHNKTHVGITEKIIARPVDLGLSCEHGNSGPSDCLDCDEIARFQALDPGVAAREIEEESELSYSEIQEIIEETVDTDPRPMHRRVVEVESSNAAEEPGEEIECAHNIPLSSNCGRCEIRTIEASQEDVIEETDQERTMRLMSAWSQAER